MLSEQNDKEARVPVTQQAEEVLQEGQKVVATNEGKENDEDEHGACPDESRHDAERASELLDGKTGRVEGNSVHSNARESEHDEKEFGEADWVHHHLDKPADTLFRGIKPVSLGVQSRSANGAENKSKTSGNGWNHRSVLHLANISKVMRKIVGIITHQYRT